MTSSDDAANPTGTDDHDLATTSAAPAFAEQADDLVVRLEAMHRADALELAAEVTHPEVHPSQEPAAGSLLSRLLSLKSR